MYRLMRRAASLIHTSEIKNLLNLSSIMFVLIFVNVKTLIRLILFLEQADLVPTGTTLVTPVLEFRTVVLKIFEIAYHLMFF